MSSTAAPFGLRPIFHPSGSVRSTAVYSGIPSAYGTAIYMGQPVKLVAGAVQPAAAADAFQGSFDGVEFTDSTGRRRVLPNWPASQATAGTPNDPNIAWIYRDPAIEYEVQASGTVAQTSVGAQADFGSASSGSSVTGYSQATLDITTLATGSNNQLRVLDVAPYVDNAWGDAYTILRVNISQHQDVAVVNGYA